MKNIDKIKDLIHNTNQSIKETFPEKLFLLNEVPFEFETKKNKKKITKIKTKKKKENRKSSKKIKDVAFDIGVFLFLLLILLLIAATVGGSIAAVIYVLIYICKIYIGEIKVFTIFFYIFPWILFLALLVLSILRLYSTGIENKRKLITKSIKIFLYLINIVAMTIQILGLIKFTKYEFMLNFIFWVISFQTFFTFIDSKCSNKQKRLDICLYEILFLEILYKYKLFDFNNYLWHRLWLLQEIKHIFNFRFINDKKWIKIKDKIINNLKINRNKLLFYNIKNELDFIMDMPIRKKNLSH